jgi:hypothetical protein
VLFEFAEEDDNSIKELSSLLERLEHDLGLAELKCYWPAKTIAVTLFAPFIRAGGTGSQDWLKCFCMYLKWAEQRELRQGSRISTRRGSWTEERNV